MIRRDRRQTCLPRYRSRPADTAEAFARDTVERLLAAMTRHGSFADAVTGAPGFDSNVLPDGIRLVSHRAQMTGAVLAQAPTGAGIGRRIETWQNFKVTLCETSRW